jgi:hypothetical protein
MNDEELRFSLEEAEALRQAGMHQAAANRAKALDVARRIARHLGRRQGLVSADDVQRWMIAAGLPPLGNAAGSIFRGEEWEFTGDWTRSERVSNHARSNRIWRYKG